MKVVHIITRMIVGGAQETALLCARGLAGLPGYQVTLVTGTETGPEGNLLDPRPAGLRVVYTPHLVRNVRPYGDARALLALRRFLQRERPDVVHTHSAKAGVVGRIAAGLAETPLVVHTNHGLSFHRYQQDWINAAYRALERSAAPFTHHYVSVSEETRRRLAAAGIGRRAGHSVIRAGFLTEEFVARLVPRDRARAELGLPPDRVVVGVVARLFPLKGHHDVLSVAERVVPRAPDVLFALVGGGPLQPELQRRVSASGLRDHVRFLGLLPPESMPAVFSAFDVLAHASVREGLARVYAQAVMAGVPVACYDLDGADEIVEDGSNGFLVPPRDLALFADRVERLVTDEGLRAKLGGVGRERVEREFSAAYMVQQLDRLYRDLLARRDGQGGRASGP